MVMGWDGVGWSGVQGWETQGEERPGFLWCFPPDQQSGLTSAGCHVSSRQATMLMALTPFPRFIPYLFVLISSLSLLRNYVQIASSGSVRDTVVDEILFLP